MIEAAGSDAIYWPGRCLMESGNHIFAIGAFKLHPDLAAPKVASDMGTPVQELVVRLYEELRIPICRYLIRMGVPTAGVDDLCQDAFLRFFETLRAGQVVENPRSWIFTVARNAALNTLAVHARTEELDEQSDAVPMDDGNVENAVLQDEKLSRIHRIVEALPTDQRECLRLRAEGFRYREIAGILGVTTSAVAGSLRRGVLRIREAIHE